MNEYSSTVLDVYADMQFGGGYSNADNVTAVTVGSDNNGDVVEFAWRYAHNGLMRVRFKVYGSIELYAGAELLCRQAQDVSISQICAIDCPAVLASLKVSSKKIHLIELLNKAWVQLLIKVKLDAQNT